MRDSFAAYTMRGIREKNRTTSRGQTAKTSPLAQLRARSWQARPARELFPVLFGNVNSQRAPEAAAMPSLIAVVRRELMRATRLR